MKIRTLQILIAPLLLIGSLASADWIEKQEELIANYEALNNLKETFPSKPESSLKKGKYESDKEFNDRLNNTRIEKVTRYYIEKEAEFTVPDDFPVVFFEYYPFKRSTVHEDVNRKFTTGENAFGAQSQMMVTRGTRQVFEPLEDFDLNWPQNYTTLSIDKEYLQKNEPEIVFIEIVEIDINDPDSFGNELDFKTAKRDDILPEDRFIRETILTGNTIAVGLYDKTNKTTVGVFSPSYDEFYYSYRGSKDDLSRGSKHDLSKGILTNTAEHYWSIPTYVPRPVYPRRAQTRGKNGYAVIEFIITTTGGVRDPILLEENPEGWGFGRAAMKAALKLRYKPVVLDGVGQEVPGVTHKFTWTTTK